MQILLNLDPKKRLSSAAFRRGGFGREEKMKSSEAMKHVYLGAHLGAFVAETVWADLPASLRHEGKRAFLNFFGGVLGVACDPAIDTIVRVLQPLAGPQHCTMIGRAERMDMLSAAFVNAVAANLLDYDDTHLTTVIH